MTYYVIDVESDGPILGKHSMVCFGAVRLDNELKTTFYGQTCPISDYYNEEALAISGFSRQEHETFEDPKIVFEQFALWLAETSTKGKLVLISDNNGYDASWINWYFHVFCGSNPFGYSSRRIGDLWCGFKNDMRLPWKYLRSLTFTDKEGREQKGFPHTHNPLEDALGNAHALLYMINVGLKLKL
ncbi:MAG: exonuclease [Paludibacter sp.]|nr:exonuclease [Paludibacter sp.]